MNNNLNDLEKMDFQNMDDEHFYKISAWSDQQKTRLFNRILQAIGKVLIVLQCRLKALNLARYSERTYESLEA